MSAELEDVGATVEHLDIMRVPRWRRTRRLAAIFAEPAGWSGGVMLWHGMVELPAILYAIPNYSSPVLIHGGNPAHTLSTRTDLLYLWVERLWWRHRHDPMYVCCSQHVSNSFEGSRYLRRFRRCVIHNGVERAGVAPHQARTMTLEGGSAPVIGMVARLDDIKDHRTLLRAFAEVRKACADARLELAGDGESASALRALAAELGLGNAVRFLGMVGDVHEAMASWDLFAYAATPQEGFGNAVAEALMGGMPVVVSDLAPLREVCGAEENVVYIPPASADALAAALLRLIPDLSERRRLGNAGRTHAMAELGAEVFAARYAALLEKEHRRVSLVQTAAR